MAFVVSWAPFISRTEQRLVDRARSHRRKPSRRPGLTGLVADVRYALGDYAGAAQLAANATARMSETDLKNPIDGTVRLTQVAAEAKLGHREQAAAALEDFKTTVPNVTTIAQIKKWMYATADLTGYEPLYEGLRLAGIKE
jgi:hypothetical protein